MLRKCLRDPIPEIWDTAKYLDAAVSAHIEEKYDLAEELIRISDKPELREWTESLWGVNSPYVKKRKIPEAPPYLPKEKRVKARMPNSSERAALHDRDGFHCRFCGIPVIRKEVREYFKINYPSVPLWGRSNIEQHAAFQLMWLQYDHVLPHARGGNNDINNIVITCAPCNYGRCDSLVEEVGLESPFLHEPVQSTWDGLERIIKANK